MSMTKWWSKCLSVVIARTASRNVAFKASTMGELLHAARSVVLTREATELFASLDDKEILEDLDYNADLYIFKFR